MITEQIIWLTIGKPIIGFCYNKAKGKAGIKIKKYREKTYKKKFIGEIDLNLLKTYQNEALYFSLSKLLNEKDVLAKIYDRSYYTNIWDFKPDNEFVDELLNNCDFIKVSERKSIRDILIHILKVCYICLNEPINDTERKLNNFFGRGLSYNNDIKKDIIKHIDEIEFKMIKYHDESMSETNIKLDKLINNTMSDKECLIKLNSKYNVGLTTESKDDYFKIQATAKITDNLQGYNTFDDFCKNVNFTCKDDEIEICSYKVINESGETLDEYCDENYYGPTLRIPDIYIDTCRITKDNKRKIVLNIIPPKTFFNVNLEDEYGNILIENLELQVSRELLPNGNIRAILNDIRKNSMVYITNLHRTTRESA